MDVSRFFLVEETADSDTSCWFSGEADGRDEDYTAESCNCDSDDRRADTMNVNVEADWDDVSSYDEVHEDDGEETKGSISDVGAALAAAEDGGGEEANKWRWSKEIMQGLDDKLFWEMCIALGFP